MDPLDEALQELGMLGTVTNARRQYQYETQRNTPLVRKNSRYVTNVSFGLRVKLASEKRRARPYKKPNEDTTKASIIIQHEERQRTRSENADAPPPMAPPSVELPLRLPVKSTLKKSRSLENVRVENDNASQPSHEMEFVSSRIQRLKMND